jgi:hypothetical protein
MTTDLLDWHEEDQSVDPEAEYRMLLNGLRRTEGFGLFFVQCSPFGGEQIIQRVRADLADQTVAVAEARGSHCRWQCIQAHSQLLRHSARDASSVYPRLRAVAAGLRRVEKTPGLEQRKNL